MDTIFKTETLADRLRKLGDVPNSRIRFGGLGYATPADVEEIHATEKRLFELVDGILVEKAMGARESLLALAIGAIIRDFVRQRKLGAVLGADGMLKLATALVRAPDVAFIARSRIPGGRLPRKKPIPNLAPNLAVEVLSECNTPAEMKRKRREYFHAGVELVWIVDPDMRTVQVFTSPRHFKTLNEKHTLDGGNVLPGFKLKLSDLFGEMDENCE